MAFNFKRPGTSFVGHISGCSAEAVALWNAGNADLSTKAGLFPMLICFFLIFSEFQTWQHLYNLKIFKNCPLTGLNPFELMTCLLVSIMSLILP